MEENKNLKTETSDRVFINRPFSTMSEFVVEEPDFSATDLPKAKRARNAKTDDQKSTDKQLEREKIRVLYHYPVS